MNKKNIIILDGTSAIWKSALLEYVDSKLPDTTVLRKVSNRPKRHSDLRVDFDFLEEEKSIQDLYYHYRFANYYYGFSKKALSKALLRYQNVIVVIRNQNVIKHIKQDYKNYNIVSVFIYSDIESITTVLGIDHDKSLECSIQEAYHDYNRNPDFYDLVVINGRQKDDFYRIVDYIIETSNTKGNTVSENRQAILLNRFLGGVISVIIGVSVNIITGKTITSTTGAIAVLCFLLTMALEIIRGLVDTLISSN